jgi:hypothetical protein
MMKMQKRVVRVGALGLAATFTLGIATAPAFARERAAKAPGHGLQVAVDATGKIRQPTAAESRALSAQFATKAATAGPQFTHWADGTISAVLTEDYLNVWLVQLNADGSAGQVCVDGANATQSAAPAGEDK